MLVLGLVLELPHHVVVDLVGPRLDGGQQAAPGDDGGEGVQRDAVPLQAVQHQLAAEFILVGHAVEGGELLGGVGDGLHEQGLLPVKDGQLGGRRAGLRIKSRSIGVPPYGFGRRGGDDDGQVLLLGGGAAAGHDDGAPGAHDEAGHLGLAGDGEHLAHDVAGVDVGGHQHVAVAGAGAFKALEGGDLAADGAVVGDGALHHAAGELAPLVHLLQASPSTVSGILGLSFSTQASTPTLGQS